MLNESMQSVFIDVLEKHLTGLMAGENEAWDACLPEMVRCAEFAIRRHFPQFEIGRHREVEELVEDAIVNILYKKILKKDEQGLQIRSGKELRGYLISTAINLTIERITKKSGKPRIKKKAEKEQADLGTMPTETLTPDPEEPSITKYDETEDPLPNPYESLRKEAEIFVVSEVLAQTPSPCKEMLTKWTWDDANGRELGEQFGLSASNALNKLAVCKEKMRKTLLRMFPKDYPFLEGNL